MKLKWKLLILHVIYCIVCVVYLYEKASLVSIDVNSISSSLIAIASVILAILGMWISYSYPNTRNTIVQDNDKVELVDSLDGAKKLESMVMAVMASAFVIIACLLSTSLIFPIIETYDLGNVNKLKIRSLEYCFLWYLCFFQVYSLFYVVKLNFDFLDKLDLLINRLKVKEKRKTN